MTSQEELARWSVSVSACKARGTVPDKARNIKNAIRTDTMLGSRLKDYFLTVLTAI